MNTEREYPHPIVVMWRVILSLPLAICWMLTFGILAAGWGRFTAELYVKFWNEVICEGDDDDSCGPDACAA